MIGINLIYFRLSDRKDTMYSQHQRLDIDHQMAVDQQINQLRDEQIRISGRSKLAIKYIDQVLNYGKNYDDATRFERLRIYHRWLDFRLRQKLLFLSNFGDILEKGGGGG